MNKDLPLFDITLKDIEQGMYKISLVDKPAIEENFIYFNETKVTEKINMFASDEKKELVGPIMIPNKEILRYDQEVGYYYVRLKKLCTSTLRRACSTHLVLITHTIQMRWLCLKFG